MVNQNKITLSMVVILVSSPGLEVRISLGLCNNWDWFRVNRLWDWLRFWDRLRSRFWSGFWLWGRGWEGFNSSLFWRPFIKCSISVSTSTTDLPVVTGSHVETVSSSTKSIGFGPIITQGIRGTSLVINTMGNGLTSSWEGKSSGLALDLTQTVDLGIWIKTALSTIALIVVRGITDSMIGLNIRTEVRSSLGRWIIGTQRKVGSSIGVTQAVLSSKVVGA
jgi:hypothetical protein